MDKRLLRYYTRELQHLRELGGEFAREFPKVAGRLALDEFACADPYVERLLEGFAFLTARVQLKLDAEFPRFTQNILQTVYPHYLAPTPSMAIVQLEPDSSDTGLAAGFTVPRGTQLRSLLGKGEQTACQYSTAHEVTLWPLEVVDAKYHSRDLGALTPPASPGVPAPKAAIRLRLRFLGGATMDKVQLSDLVFHIRGTGEAPPRIYEQLLARTTRCCVRGASGNAAKNPWHIVEVGRPIVPLGFGDDEAMLPHGPRSFQGYRLLQEYFAFPQRFMFVSMEGIGNALRATKDREVDVLILLSAEARELENALDPSHFALHCTPAVNLFSKRTDRIHVSDHAWEYQVIPDRTRPLDFEVFQVLSLTGFGNGTQALRVFRPFYSVSERSADAPEPGAYFTVNRVPRTPSAKEQRGGRRSSYLGSEVYVSVVDTAATPYRPELKQLGAETLCTNRDLPLQMPVGRGTTDFTMELSGPIRSVRCIAGPTPPRPSTADGEIAWRLISHMSLNYLSLVNSDDGTGAASLRDLLKLYGDAADPQIGRQIEGVRGIASRPISRQVAGPGPIAFARGLELSVTLDDAAFEGTGIAVLGAVLDQFFARYVSMNSFTETVVHAADRGEVMRWPARVGRRQLL